MTKKVLVAEDHAGFAKSLANYITSLGFEVTAATNGWQAYEILADNPDGTFFAVVSDMRMPGGSGLTFCQAANRQTDCPPTLIHSSDMSFTDGKVIFDDINMMKDIFDFVKVVHKKPAAYDTDFGYVKEFLDSIAA